MHTHLNDLKALRDSTNIGDEIRFKVAKNDCDKPTIYTSARNHTIRGRVVKKYDRIFYLDDGKCYQWVDYLIGRVK